MSDTELWARRLERERRARKEAETLLESKSHELYLANNALQQSYNAIAAAKNYTENILRSLMNALIVVAPDGIVCIAQDITERQQAEELRRQTEAAEEARAQRAQAEHELQAYIERRHREVDRLVEAARHERRSAAGETDST